MTIKTIELATLIDTEGIDIIHPIDSAPTSYLNLRIRLNAHRYPQLYSFTCCDKVYELLKEMAKSDRSFKLTKI